MAVAPSREALVVAVACVFTWYWLADLGAQEDIPFVLGHALYRKALQGGKARACLGPGLQELSTIDVGRISHKSPPSKDFSHYTLRISAGG